LEGSGAGSTSARRWRRSRARDLGINFFDTAQAYGFGASERLLGRALRDELGHRRDQVVIATEGGLRDDDERPRDASPEWLRRGVDESLLALGVDYIDLYQVHWPNPDTPFGDTARALQEIVDEGEIRHVGVSNYGAEQMAEFARAPARSRPCSRCTTCSSAR
jgi:aryl-alcohol dehydrogenase-like predicted oxidoreductase